MKYKKGLSDVVTTVVIIALALVAITVVWMVVQGLISSNSDTIDLQQKCLQVGIEVSATNTSNDWIISVKRISGSAELDSIRVYAYNDSTSSTKTINGNIKVGEMKSADKITMTGVKRVAAVASFKDEQGNIFDCSPPVEKVI